MLLRFSHHTSSLRNPGKTAISDAGMRNKDFNQSLLAVVSKLKQCSNENTRKKASSL
jgi:putative lipoic acid-binding regulatory protein